MKTAGLHNNLDTFDVTSLVVGSIIGADIYVATAFGAKLIGPSSLLVWILAGVMAMAIAISFAYCATIQPKVGGPYAYIHEAYGRFPGFMIGWSLLLAEWLSLAVFPVAFTQYFVALVPGISAEGQVLLKGAFIAIILITNLLGVKAAGRTNDLLTVAKLTPLLLIIAAGIFFLFLQTSTVTANFQPFFIGGPEQVGQALILIFWAYAGFELSTIPADKVEKPDHTIPKAIVLGMSIVIIFYLMTNLVVVSTLDEATLSSSSSPLLATTAVLFSPLAGLAGALVLVVGIGALLSILGADESGTIGTSRLAYAMSLDGLLPAAFSKESKRSEAPYVALIVLCLTAFVASLIGGLSTLINASVFMLAVVYLATCVSTLRLEKLHPKEASPLHLKIVLPLVGAGLSLILILLVNPTEIVISLVLMAVGIPIYVWFSPRQELKELRSTYLSTEEVLLRAYRQSTRFLALPVTEAHLIAYRLRQRRKRNALAQERRKDKH